MTPQANRVRPMPPPGQALDWLKKKPEMLKRLIAQLIHDLLNEGIRRPAHGRELLLCLIIRPIGHHHLCHLGFGADQYGLQFGDAGINHRQITGRHGIGITLYHIIAHGQPQTLRFTRRRTPSHRSRM